jgi:hypothetical protein
MLGERNLDEQGLAIVTLHLLVSDYGLLHYRPLADHLPHVIGISHDFLHHQLHLQLFYLVCHASDAGQLLPGFQEILLGLPFLLSKLGV